MMMHGMFPMELHSGAGLGGVRRLIYVGALVLLLILLAAMEAWAQVHGAPTTPGPPGLPTTTPPNAPGRPIHPPPNAPGMPSTPLPGPPGLPMNPPASSPPPLNPPPSNPPTTNAPPTDAPPTNAPGLP